MQWIRSAIPNLQDLVRDFQDFLEAVYTTAGKRTKRAMSRIKLANLGCTEKHTAAFSACKEAIATRYAQEARAP